MIDIDRYASNWNNAAACIEALSQPDPDLLEWFPSRRNFLEAKQREFQRLAKRLERINRSS